MVVERIPVDLVTDLGLPDYQLVIIGLSQSLKELMHDSLRPKLGDLISADLLGKAQEKLGNCGGCVNVYLDSFQGLTEQDMAFLNDMVFATRNTARMVDMPCCELNTLNFVEEARNVAAELNEKVSTTVYQGEELRERGFGGIYNVGKCAKYPPAFVVLSYVQSEATETYALVGKGIVFDTGGMQLKTKSGMPGMKRDMGGAAAVLNGFWAAVRAGFRHNLHAILCLAENMIGGEATKPDDIIRMLSGKTVEINNTDAEGRLVLGDGVYYAQSVLKAGVIIDMATLTGAQSTATGNQHAALVTNSDAWERLAVEAGRFSGDLVHPLPYSPDIHFPELSSSFADMKNSNLGKSEAGSAIASLFIGLIHKSRETISKQAANFRAPSPPPPQ